MNGVKNIRVGDSTYVLEASVPVVYAELDSMAIEPNTLYV
jgi:hypothetical protein